MLTAADLENVKNATIYINDTRSQLSAVIAELGQVISPQSEVYDSLSTILLGLDGDLEKVYNRVCWLNDDEYVAY